jgi:hypothetical protein
MWPDGIHHLFLADHPARVLDQIAQYFEALGPQLRLALRSTQAQAIEIEREASKLEGIRRHDRLCAATAFREFSAKLHTSFTTPACAPCSSRAAVPTVSREAGRTVARNGSLGNHESGRLSQWCGLTRPRPWTCSSKGEGGFFYPFCFSAADGKVLAGPPFVIGKDIRTFKYSTGKEFGKENFKAAIEGKITKVRYLFPRTNDGPPVQWPSPSLGAGPKTEEKLHASQCCDGWSVSGGAGLVGARIRPASGPRWYGGRSQDNAGVGSRRRHPTHG